MIKKINLKSKKADVFGMSFTMIFSILLIIFFVVAAFIAIKFFLGIQKKAQLGLALQGLQSKIDEAWNAGSASIPYNVTLPSGIEYACLANLSAHLSSGVSSVERAIFEGTVYGGGSVNVNFILWPPESAGDLAFTTLKNVQYEKKNPYCFTIKNRMLNLRIEKKADSALPSLV